LGVPRIFVPVDERDQVRAMAWGQVAVQVIRGREAEHIDGDSVTEDGSRSAARANPVTFVSPREQPETDQLAL
jgi:hypothetical protein